MNSRFTFNEHDNLRGKHALFAPSQSSWLRYDDDKIAERVRNQYRTTLGTEIHDFAASQIDLGHKYSSVREIMKDIETYMYCKYMYLNEKLEVNDYAKKLIANLKTLPKEVFEAVRDYINHGVGFKMNVEQGLQYSEYCFGHADTICFRDNVLRIHDLKTGANPAHMEQLKVYAALFCLEYEIHPRSITIILRLYQWDGIEQLIINTESEEYEELIAIMDRIIATEKIAREIDKED